jgi:hypothetical protein
MLASKQHMGCSWCCCCCERSVPAKSAVNAAVVLLVVGVPWCRRPQQGHSASAVTMAGLHDSCCLSQGCELWQLYLLQADVRQGEQRAGGVSSGWKEHSEHHNSIAFRI